MHGKLINFKNRPERRSAGFTLTEVLVASTLLIVAMVPILKCLTTVHASTISIEQKTRSLAFAKAKLDEIKAKSIYNYSSSFAGANLALGDSYICNVTDSSAGSNLRTITVSTGQDIDHNNILSINEVAITLSTYIARRM